MERLGIERGGLTVFSFPLRNRQYGKIPNLEPHIHLLIPANNLPQQFEYFSPKQKSQPHFYSWD